jgi:hypothetical protein
MSSYRDTQQPEWTVARSFRLLRPIISRKSASQRQRGLDDRPSREIKKPRLQDAPSRARFGDSPNPRLDPDWMHKSRKAVPRQYSRLMPSSSSDPVVDASFGTFSIPTPLIQRTMKVQVAEKFPAVSNRINHPGVRGTYESSRLTVHVYQLSMQISSQRNLYHKQTK